MLEVPLTLDLVSPETDFEEMQSHLLEHGEQNHQTPATRLALCQGIHVC